jgi:hypothetical protein
MRKTKLVNPITKYGPEGARIYYYFRAPPGMALPEGVSTRLPDDAQEAQAAARQLASICVPFGLGRRAGRAKGRLEDMAERVFSAAKRRAKQREQAFAISLENVIELMRAQDYRCALSGIAFRHEDKGDLSRAPFRPSLDRIRSREGYVPGNVRLVLVAVNFALSDWGEEVLFEIADGIAARRDNRIRRA